jgi:2,3-bisphosphoglycerate-independent phosphoglycerate mutase
MSILFTADHGNCEEVGNKENPHTAHTTNKVPLWYIENGEVMQNLKEE